MRDRFRPKIWIFVAQFLIFFPLSIFAIVMGILMWTGNLRDANGEYRTDGGVPCTLMGVGMLLFSSYIAFNIYARAQPIIRCYREGLEFLAVGQTDLDGVPLMPNSIRLFFAIVSLQGFRSVRYRIPWDQFQSAQIGGLPLARVLYLHGTVTNLTTGHVGPYISIPQVALAHDLQQVANTLLLFAKTPASRAKLIPWKAETPVLNVTN